jgi:hypothetical protein
MLLHLEDCVNCVKDLALQFDYLFLFNRSCGHKIQREEGLNIENMTKSFDGKQAYLYDSLIKEVDGYLRPYPKVLKPGDVQLMVFKESDSGTFWLTEQERIEQRHDQIETGKKVKRKLKKEVLVKTNSRDRSNGNGEFL